MSLKKALESQGFMRTGRSNTEWNRWVESEKEKLSDIMLEYGVEWDKKGTHEKHKSVSEFKRDKLVEEVETLEDKKQDCIDDISKYKKEEDFALATAKKLEDEAVKMPEPTPLMSAKTYKTKYAEPFVGGGAVLFDILDKYDLDEVYISDINAELINTYIKIRDNADELINLLYRYQNEYIPLETAERKSYYISKRERFNELKINGNAAENTEKAALMIFLNKTCFNGLYRVNRKGLFNVPMGAYKNPLICDENNLRAVSDKLKNVEIVCGDYSKSGNFIDENTFVYFDPPYRPLSSTARRAGWVGCNILLDKIPLQGRISIVSNGSVENRDSVLRKTQTAQSLKIESISARGWLMDILHCVNMIDADEFYLKDMYHFEALLRQKHPDNNNVKPKIRQQLQFLRDKGIIEFLGDGHYRKII